MFSLCLLFPMTYFDQISPNLAKISQRPENQKDYLVKIIYGFVVSSLFKRAGNSN